MISNNRCVDLNVVSNEPVTSTTANTVDRDIIILSNHNVTSGNQCQRSTKQVVIDSITVAVTSSQADIARAYIEDRVSTNDDCSIRILKKIAIVRR